jgi:hypothetical protein
MALRYEYFGTMKMFDNLFQRQKKQPAYSRNDFLKNISNYLFTTSRIKPMKKVVGILIIGLIFIVYSQISVAKPVDKEKSEKVTKAFLKNEQLRDGKNEEKLVKEGKKILHSIQKNRLGNTTPLYGDDNQVLAWVTELQPEGYIVTSAEDRITPIISYSFTGNFPFEESKHNVLLHLVRGDMQGRLKAINSKSDAYLSKAGAYAQEWQEYSSDDITIIPLSDPAQWPAGDNEGWLDTTWYQLNISPNYSPFDPTQNPTVTNGLLTGSVRCSTGCTATAMAQIVNYWQFPTSISLTNSDNYISSYTPENGTERRIWMSFLIVQIMGDKLMNMSLTQV